MKDNKELNIEKLNQVSGGIEAHRGIVVTATRGGKATSLPLIEIPRNHEIGKRTI